MIAPDSASENGQVLVLRAINNSGGYTSGRINTSQKFFQCYGRIEARILLPSGKGLWPAFWMLGVDCKEFGGSVEWPLCGEIDILEFKGHEVDKVHTSLHGPTYSAEKCVSKITQMETDLTRDYHVYAIEWSAEEIHWFIDSKRVFSVTKASIAKRGKTWVFSKPFFIILNLAIGGSFLGKDQPDKQTLFSAEMRVDYVKVYAP